MRKILLFILWLKLQILMIPTIILLFIVNHLMDAVDAAANEHDKYWDKLEASKPT